MPLNWSEDVQLQTRAALQELSILPASEFVYLKNIDGRFGEISLANVVAKRFDVIDRRTAEHSRFREIDELIQAGWALD